MIQNRNKLNCHDVLRNVSLENKILSSTEKSLNRCNLYRY